MNTYARKEFKKRVAVMLNGSSSGDTDGLMWKIFIRLPIALFILVLLSPAILFVYIKDLWWMHR